MLSLYMRTIPSVIAAVLMGIMIPLSAQAAGIDQNIHASLKLLQPEERIPPADLSPNEPEPVKGRFLVATRKLEKSFFAGAVIFMIDHSDQGSTGLVINRPSSIRLSALFPDEDIFLQSEDRIYSGGPVALKSIFVLVLSDSTPPDAQHVIDNLYMTSTLETGKYLKDRTGTTDTMKVIAGYAGWYPGQLASEIARGSWHVMTGNAELIFDKDPGSLWERFIEGRAEK